MKSKGPTCAHHGLAIPRRDGDHHRLLQRRAALRAKARKGLGTGRSHRERGIRFARGALVVRKDSRRDAVLGKLRTHGLNRLMREHRNRVARIARPAQSTQLAIGQRVFIHAKG